MNRRVHRWWVVLFIPLVGLGAPRQARSAPGRLPFNPANPPQGVFMDDWYSVSLAGTTCGWMHAFTRRDGGVIGSQTEMHFALRRGTAQLSIEMSQSHRETIDGKPLAFEQTMNMAGQPLRQRGEIRGDKVRLTTEQFGTSQHKMFPFDPQAKFPWAQWLEQQRRGLRPGTRYVFKSYEPSIASDRVIETEAEVLGREVIDLMGRRTPAIKVRTTAKLAVPMTTDVWVDDLGTVLFTEMNLGIVKVRVARTDERTARQTGKPPELFVSTFVNAHGGVDRRADRLNLRLSVSEGMMPDLPTTSMQRPRRVNARTIDLAISRIDWKRLRRTARNRDIPDEIARQYLECTPFMDCKDPTIVRLARRGAGRSSNPAAKADALRKFVTEYVTDKDLDVAFATATEVARTRQGDCTEHGVLLAALARASGLPARVAAGLIMLPDAEPDDAKFGYHMWTQVYIDGDWVDIDAAMRQTDCDPTHIALAVMSLREGELMEGSLPMLPLLGRLKIQSRPGPR